MLVDETFCSFGRSIPMKIWNYVTRLPLKRQARKRPPKKLVLVVEDDASNSQMIQLAIEQETPFQVLVAATGAEALQSLEKTRPDLILLDYMLPDLNGLQVYERMRTIPSLKAVPVVFLTANLHKAALETAHLPLLEKPFDLDTFFETLRHHLESV